MNTHDVISQQPPLPSPRKPRFIEICMDCKLGNDNFPVFADLAGVSVDIIEKMFTGEPVPRGQAEKVLDFLSLALKRDLTLDTVDIPLLNPTFADLYLLHQFSTNVLAIQAHVLPETIDFMLLGRPVSKQNAIRVLQGLSRRLGLSYRLDNVDVPTIDIGEGYHA